MEEIAKLLMERDGISESEAIQRIQEGKTAIIDALMEEGDEAAQEAFKDYFDLEVDYMVHLL